MKIVYIAHPLGSGQDREANRALATKWVVWAANQGVAPIASWILIASEWQEDRKTEGLEIDCRLIDVCEEVWLCGPRISPGMTVESLYAEKLGIPIRHIVEMINVVDYYKVCPIL